MTTDKTPEEQLAETSARLAISQKYLARDDNPDLDPFRQDQIDKNRIPADIVSEPASPSAEAETPHDESTKNEEDALAGVARVGDELGDALTKSLRDQPYLTLGLAALAGIVLGAIWKA